MFVEWFCLWFLWLARFFQFDGSGIGIIKGCFSWCDRGDFGVNLLCRFVLPSLKDDPSS